MLVQMCRMSSRQCYLASMLTYGLLRPNDGFMRQLDIFHQASFKVSKRDKETRLFYLERVVNEVMST